MKGAHGKDALAHPLNIAPMSEREGMRKTNGPKFSVPRPCPAQPPAPSFYIGTHHVRESFGRASGRSRHGYGLEERVEQGSVGTGHFKNMILHRETINI